MLVIYISNQLPSSLTGLYLCIVFLDEHPAVAKDGEDDPGGLVHHFLRDLYRHRLSRAP